MMPRPGYFGWLLFLPMVVGACAREAVSLGGDDAGSGPSASGASPVGTGGALSAEAGRGGGAQAGSGPGQPLVECVVGGCSSQLCVRKGESAGSTCEWLETGGSSSPTCFIITSMNESPVNGSVPVSSW